MKIAQFEDGQGFWIGTELDGKWINFSKAESVYYLLEHGVTLEPMRQLDSLIESGEMDLIQLGAVHQFVKKGKLARQFAMGRDAVMKAPILRPRKIVALGLNYALHVKEGGFEAPTEPVIFVKAGTSVIGPEDTIRLPRGMGRMDHEVELAIVIGKQASGVRKKDAFRYVAGYTICNDVTARTLQSKDIRNKHPWFRSKSFDTFTPLGPWLVTADEIPTPVHLGLECRVNGRIRQKANTRDLVFDIPTIIEFVSKHITLEPTDIISTGTPAGIGPITDGDVVVCKIDKVGQLRNHVRFK